MKIPVAHIEPQLKGRERSAVMEELLARLVHAGAVAAVAKPAFLAALTEREQCSSTGMGAGWALPHAQSELISEPVPAFGRSRDGVQFDAVDGRPVEFVLLFLLPAGADIAQFLPHRRGTERGPAIQDGSRKGLRECSTAEEIAEILNQCLDDGGPVA